MTEKSRQKNLVGLALNKFIILVMSFMWYPLPLLQDTRASLPTAKDWFNMSISHKAKCRAVDDKFEGAFFSFIWRWLQLEEISQRIKEETEKLTKITNDELGDKCFFLLTLDIETFYVTVRSLMEDIAAMTPCFYPRGPEKPKRRSFKGQIKWYENHPDFDSTMTDYLKNKLGWFNELRDVRDDLLHNQAFLWPFPLKDEQGKFQLHFYIVSAEDKKIITYELMIILQKTLLNLIEFMNFYTEHFTKRLPNDWQYYEEWKNVSTEAPDQGFEELNRLLKESRI